MLGFLDVQANAHLRVNARVFMHVETKRRQNCEVEELRMYKSVDFRIRILHSFITALKYCCGLDFIVIDV